jgi:hypothetical protein
LKRHSLPRRNAKGLRLVRPEVVPPRNGWSLSLTESLRTPTRKQSTAPYARSMGARRIPITRGIAVSMRKTVLQREPSQGRACSSSAIHTIKTRHARVTIVTRSCPQRSQSLKNLTRNSSARIRSASAIVTATVTTPTPPQVMGRVDLGN